MQPSNPSPRLVAKLPLRRRTPGLPGRWTVWPRSFGHIGLLCGFGCLTLGAGALFLPAMPARGQTAGDRRPVRAQPPRLDPQAFEGIFFASVSDQLRGDFPVRDRVGNRSASVGDSRPGGDLKPGTRPEAVVDRTTPMSEADLGGAISRPQRRDDGEAAWSDLIDAASLEDTVKRSKGELDQLVASASRFAGGGYLEARREFFRLSLAFAVIAEYPREVRWQSSAAVASVRLARMAAACRVGSTQLHSQARRQLQELDDLLSGLKWELQPGEALLEDDWTTDRTAVMQIMEYDLRSVLLPAVANPQRMQADSEEAWVAAQWLAVLGQVLLKSGMQDADDEEYRRWCWDLIDQARQTAGGIERAEQPAARQSAGRIDQVCSQCHSDYR
jgi:hypothetical protein